MNLGSLHIHPVKSGRAIGLETAELYREGLRFDRRFMIVDAGGRFVSQRELPPLARLEVEIAEDGLILVYGDKGERFVPTPDGAERITARIWRDDVDVALADEATNAAISRWLGEDLRLVYQDRVERDANAEFAAQGSLVSLADGYPILVTTAASLRDLNTHLVAGGFDPVTMSRFRPNLVIDEADAWAEDAWKTIRVGGIVLDLVKPCARCVMTTVDQNEGVVTGKQPLSLLRELRMSADRAVPGVLFGWNAVPRTEGTLNVGDRVDVLETRDGPVVRPARTSRTT